MQTDVLTSGIRSHHSLIELGRRAEGFKSREGAATAEARVAALYRRYGPSIYSRCKRLLRNEAMAEDAVQEVFLKVYRHLDQAPDDQAAWGWICRISTNHCLDQMRRRRVRGDDTANENLEEPSHNPESAIQDRDLVMGMLHRAPEKLRAPALLYHVDGMEQAQIATVLQISRRTVINRLAEFSTRMRKYALREAA
jgi:RNA polymerase sigma-70 factor (ECF subfamily)